MDNDFEPKVPTVEARGMSAVAKMGHLVGVLAPTVDGHPYAGPRAGEPHAHAVSTETVESLRQEPVEAIR